MNQKNYILHILLLVFLTQTHTTKPIKLKNQIKFLENQAKFIKKELYFLSKKIALCRKKYNKNMTIYHALGFSSNVCNRKQLEKEIKVLEKIKAQLEEQYINTLMEKQHKAEQNKQNDIKKYHNAKKVTQIIIRNSLKFAHQKKQMPVPPYEPMLWPLEPIIHNNFVPSTYSNKNLDNVQNSSDNDSLCYICMQSTEKIIAMEKICLGNHKGDFICKICKEENEKQLANQCPLCRKPLNNKPLQNINEKGKR